MQATLIYTRRTFTGQTGLRKDVYKRQIHGISESSPEHYWDKSVFRLAKDRTMWLIICLVTATFTSLIIKRYETLLASSVALAAYIPCLLYTSKKVITMKELCL